MFPLVTARVLAHEFTYLVPEEAGLGAIVRIRLGGRRVRGVVTELDVTPPPGIELSEIEEVVGQLPAPLVELALWLAGYYGSTPGRALALVRAGHGVTVMPDSYRDPEVRRVKLNGFTVRRTIGLRIGRPKPEFESSLHDFLTAVRAAFGQL